MKNLSKKLNQLRKNQHAITFLLSIATLFILCSCSKDDDKTITSDTYELTSFTIANPYDLDNNGTASTNVFNEINCNFNYKIILNSDNTGQFTFSSSPLLYFDFDSNEYVYECITPSQLGTQESIDLTYTIIGETISYQLTGQTDTVIGTITNSEIVITLPEGFAYQILGGPNDGDLVMETTTSVYTKQP